jgi:hypothetical protein
MTRLIGGVLGLIGAFWLALAGGGGVYWWATRAPPGWPNLRVLVWTFHLPDAPGARLAAMQRAARAAQAQQVRLAARREAASAEAGAAHALAQARLRVVYRTLVKEIPVHVPAEVDRGYPLPVGLVRLHDAAARGVAVSAVPAPAGRADDAAADSRASDLAAVLAHNYGACRADGEQLSALQAWVRAQEALH